MDDFADFDDAFALTHLNDSTNPRRAATAWGPGRWGVFVLIVAVVIIALFG